MSGPPRRNRRVEYTGGARRAVHSLHTFVPPRAPRWPVGLQAATAYALPVLLGAATGHEQWGLLAASGAFTIFHLSWLPARERLKVLPLVSMLLIVCTALGTAMAPYPVASALVLIGVAVVAALGYLAFHMGPPGPIFAVMTYGLGAHATVPVDGMRHLAPATVVEAVAVGCAISCVIAATPLLSAKERRRRPRPLREIVPGPDIDQEARELLIRIGIVAVVGTMISLTMVDPDRVYWTVGSGLAVIGMRATRGEAAQRGLHRCVGTLAGVLLFAVLAQVSWTAVPLALALGALQFATQETVVRNYALGLTFVTPLALLITTVSTGAPSLPTVEERVIDTAVGAFLGAITGLIHRSPGARLAAP